MPPENEAHLERIIQDTVKELAIKYRLGQAEHGGNLWLKSGIINSIRGENNDSVVYLHVMEEQLRLAEKLLQEGKHAEALIVVSAMLSKKTEDIIEAIDKIKN